MIAGRLHWKPRGAKAGGRADLAAFEFPTGTLTLTEAGTKRRASLHLVRGAANLDEFRRGGLEVLDATVDAIRRAASLGESHGEAVAHRSATVQRNRQCLLGRDPAPRQAVAGQAHVASERRGDRRRCSTRRERFSPSGPIAFAPRRRAGFPRR